MLYLFSIHLATVVMSISDASNTRYGSIVYLVHTHRRHSHHDHHQHHRKNYMYRQLMRCDCSEGVDKFTTIDRY